MEGISSTPVEDSVKFLRLRDQYKSKLLDDSRLTKAAELAAQQHILFESKAPDTWKEPRLKHWTKKRIYLYSKFGANHLQMPHLLNFAQFCHMT